MERTQRKEVEIRTNEFNAVAEPMQGKQQPQTQQFQNVNVIINQKRKSVGVAILLTVFFGPLGMLYSTTLGAIIMIVVSLIVGIPTLGIGVLFTQPICIIWGAIAANNANKQGVQMQGVQM